MNRLRRCFLLFSFLLATLLPSFAFSAEFDFPGVFLAEGEEPVAAENSYRSQNIAIEITSVRVDNCDVYVADIYVRSLDCFRRVFAGNPWDKRAASIRTMAPENGAVLALTGDNSRLITAGFVFANGELLRQSVNSKRDLCILLRSGEMKVLTAGNIDHDQLLIQAPEIWHSFLFGPSLLDENGAAFHEFTSSVRAANPRSVIGYYEPGHYCFVQVDGRGTQSALEEKRINTGMTMEQLAAFMESLDCSAAYNLDGGQSSMMWFGEEVISMPYHGGRSLGDILVITDVRE